MSWANETAGAEELFDAPEAPDPDEPPDDAFPEQPEARVSEATKQPKLEMKTL